MVAFSSSIFISWGRKASGDVRKPLRIWASGHGGTSLSLVHHRLTSLQSWVWDAEGTSEHDALSFCLNTEHQWSVGMSSPEFVLGLVSGTGLSSSTSGGVLLCLRVGTPASLTVQESGRREVWSHLNLHLLGDGEEVGEGRGLLPIWEHCPFFCTGSTWALQAHGGGQCHTDNPGQGEKCLKTRLFLTVVEHVSHSPISLEKPETEF